MKKYFLFLALGLSVLGFSLACDKDETTTAWVWTYQDSLDVMTLLEPEEDFLSSTCHVPIGGVDAVIPEEFLEVIRSDTSHIRYLVSDFSFSITDTIYAYLFDLGLDTTVTAYVLDSLQGKVELKVDSFIERGSDTAVALDTTISKTLRFASRNDVFFDSLGGDATWRITKYSGGTRGHAPDVATAPDLDSIILSYSGGKLTVMASAEPDVYGVRSLLETDKLIHVSQGEEISVDEVFAAGNDTLVFYICDDKGNWQSYESGTGVTGVTFNTAGKSHLYVVGINLQSFVRSSEEWSSVLWGIPVIVE